MRKKKPSAKVRRTEKLIEYFRNLKEVTNADQWTMIKGVLLMEYPFKYPDPDRTVVGKCFDAMMLFDRMTELNAKMLTEMGYVSRRRDEGSDALDRLVEHK